VAALLRLVSPHEASATGRIAPGTGIVIVRHGEAVANIENFVGGPQSCAGLTERGRAQVAALSQRLAATGELSAAVALYASTLRRAVETAEILAPALGGLEIEERAELCEQHPGEADGMTWEAVERAFGRTLPGDRPGEPLAPGGESWVSFGNRIERALTEIGLAHPGGLSVVAAHGGVVLTSLIRLLEIPGRSAPRRFFCENASITEWRYGGQGWRLLRFNDIAHLDKALRSPIPQWAEAGAEPERR